jgi:uncharacterized protein YndB with AHSA1/START domain
METTIEAPAYRVYEELAALDSYPDWLDLITTVERAEAAPADPGPAWLVTLRAKVGPFARSKRLRMTRTVADEPHRLTFERAEIDGREHAAWTLDVEIEPEGELSRVSAALSYGGSLWTTPLEAVLRRELDGALPKLRNLLDR